MNKKIQLIMCLPIVMTIMSSCSKESESSTDSGVENNPSSISQSNSVTGKEDDEATQDDEKLQNSESSVDDETISLEEFLKKLTCNGCGRHCPLTNLHCRRGEEYQEAAKQEYYDTVSAME